jgi:putative peptidoglycan binding protein
VAYANGRIPASALHGIPGNGRLIRSAALCYIAMSDAASKAGVNMALWESRMRRTYREFAAQVYARQYWCSLGKCGNAAVPGTSNHGWGINVDLMSMTQRNYIDSHGAHYGFSKRWSDAAWEWWHITWRNVGFHPPPPGPRTLKPGVRPGKDVRHLQWMLSRIPLAHPDKTPGPDKYYFKRRYKRGMGYGRRVQRAVKQFQRDHGLKPDGIVGPNTWKKIKAAYKRHHK